LCTARGRFLYEFDYGDGWQHRIVVEQVRRDVPLVRARLMLYLRASVSSRSAESVILALHLLAIHALLEGRQRCWRRCSIRLK
jgi:hypothetical protein